MLTVPEMPFATLRFAVVKVPATETLALHVRSLLTVRAPPVIVPFGIELLALSVSCVPFRFYVKLSSYATVVTCVGDTDWPLLPPT